MAGAICKPHSRLESSLLCARCETPLCGRCVVASPVGTRCRTCAPKAEIRPLRQRTAEASPLFGFIASDAGRLAIFVVMVAVCAAAVAYSWLEGDRDRFVIRAIVYGGWLVSLVLHEFSHSLVAYLGDDREVRTRGFLTLNPLKFMDPVYSIAIPVLFTLIGGVPIIGGRTLIDGSALRSRWWSTAVSLAGPGVNVLIAVGISFVFRLGVLDPFSPVAAGLGYLAVLQVAAAAFNLIPIPPLDGFGALCAHLPPEAQMRARAMGRLGYFALLAAFWYSAPLNGWYWGHVYDVADSLHIPWIAQYLGYLGATFRR